MRKKIILIGTKRKLDMKKVFYTFAAVLILGACGKETMKPEMNNEEEGMVTVTVGVNMDDNSTKVEIGQDGETRFLKWKDGDVISIGLKKKEDDSVTKIDATIHTVGDNAYVSFSYNPTVYDITDARYPQGGINTGIPTTQYMWRGDIILPMTASYDGSQSSITFAPVTDEYSIVKYSLKKGNIAKSLKSISVSYNGGTPYTLDTYTKMNNGANAAVPLTDDAQDFYVVIPSGVETHALKATFTMDDGTVYTRTKKTFTPTAKKLHNMPTISDMDDTGKHFWQFGTGVDNASEAPFKAWFNTDKLNFSNFASRNGYVTVTMTTEDKLVFKGHIGPVIRTSNHVYRSQDGLEVTNVDSDRLAIHAGNYPIFAIKMNSPWKYTSGTSQYTIALDTNSPDSYWGTLNGRSFKTDNTSEHNYERDLPYPSVFYYDLTAANVFPNAGGSKVSGAAPDTRILNMYTWQLKFELRYASAHAEDITYNIYWAGFFNSKKELDDYIAAHPL